MKKLFLLLCISAIQIVSLNAQTASRINGSPYPVSQTPDTLYVVDMEYYTPDQRLTTITLQGMLAKTKPMIFCWDLSGYGKWIEDFDQNYNVHIDSTYWQDFDGLVTHFSDRIDKYYLCDLDTASTSVAITACGSHTDKIAVTTNILPLMNTLGITEEFDCRNQDEQWLLDNFASLYSTKIITYQDHTKSTFLGDYTIFSGAFQFFADIDDQLTTDAFARMDPNSAMFGWGPDERYTVQKASENSVSVNPADWSRNLSVMSNFEAPTVQNTHPTSVIEDDNVHTVCFLMTDGDNINWMLHEFAEPSDNRWYGSSERGQVDIGWTISPALSELAPTIMKYVYDSASNTSTAQDNFVASSSGMGYMYPNYYPELDTSTNLLNEYMAKADLNILNVIGTDYNDNYMLPFLEQSNIDAIFYYDYDNYAALNGAINWVNDKPVIGARYNLWSGFETPQSLATKLNNASTDAYSADGYSLIDVHVWTMTTADVNECASLLDSNVIVVTPEEFVQRIQAKMGPTTNITLNKTEADFTIYPNPAKSVIQLHFDKSYINKTAQIIDITGKIIKEIKIQEDNISVNISELENGFYLIRVNNQTKQFIKG